MTDKPRQLWHADLPITPAIFIANDGRELKETNYWETAPAKCHFAFLSWNAGAARLLLPTALAAIVLPEVQGAREVVISRGPWPETGRPVGIEVMFEDDSQTPYAMHLVEEQTDRRIPADTFQPFVCALWTPKGKVLELPAHYREVETVPWMQPWSQG